MGGNYDFPHTMVTAGGPGHSQAQGKVKHCWGASINGKIIYERSFFTFQDQTLGDANGPPALPFPTALFLLLLHHHKHHELHRDSISESSMFEC